MSWDEEAATWDGNPAVRAYNEAAFAGLQKFLNDEEASLAGLRVLDFGCGTGLLSAAIADLAREVVAFDVSPAMIDALRKKELANVKAQAGELVDVAHGFDLVTCSSVCAFVEDYPGTVRQLVERLEPGGWFVQWDWELDPSAEEPYGLSRDAIRRALEAAGLVDIAVRVGFELPFEGMTMAPLMGAGLKPG